MDFGKLITIASKNEIKNEKKRAHLKPGLAPVSAPKKDAKQAKGIQSAAVRAFVAEQERKDKEAAAKLKQKPTAGGTKDASGAETKAPNSKPSSQAGDEEEEPLVDLKHLFTKNDRRVARLPDSSLNMLELLKERERKLKQKQKEEEEERLQREKELLREREREKEKEREAKEKGKSKHSSSERSDSHSKSKHGSSSEKSVSSGSSGRPSQFKIPKKPQPPPMSFEELLKVAEKKHKEPDAAPSPAASKPSASVAPVKEPSRPMTQAEKDRQERTGSQEYQNWLKYGGRPPSGLSAEKPSSSRGKGSSLVQSQELRSSSSSTASKQLDRRKPDNSERSRSQDKVNNGHVSSDRGHAGDRDRSGRQLQSNDRNAAERIKLNSAQNNASISLAERARQLAKEMTKRMGVANSKSNSEPNSKSNVVRENGSKTERRSCNLSDLELSNKRLPVQKDASQNNASTSKGTESRKSNIGLNQRLQTQRDGPHKNAIAGKSTEASKSSAGTNKPQDSRSNSSLNNRMSTAKNASIKPGPKSEAQKDLIRNFLKQFEQLKAMGILPDEMRSLVREHKEQMEALTKNNSNVSRGSAVSGNSSTKSQAEPKRNPSTVKMPASKPPPPPPVNRSQAGPSKSEPSNRPKAADGRDRKEVEKKAPEKQMTAWDRIRSENQQFKPPPMPESYSKRKWHEVESDEDDDDDEEEDDYEDEEDDMGDFIDDEADDDIDYSSYLRQLTKYDPRRFKDDDFDDRLMETSYSQQLKEEAFSAKEGRREDLEDMLMEERELRQKLLKKNAAKKMKLR